MDLTTPARHARRSHLRRVVATAAGLVTLVAGLGALPARATTTPVAGAACGTDDVGRRAPVVSSLNRQGVITHFLAVNVTTGTGGAPPFTVPVVDAVTTDISGNTTTTTSWTTEATRKISTSAGYTVNNVPKSTVATDISMLWTFTYPGYYALYHGVRRPTGTLDALHCLSVTQPDGTATLQWVARPAGTYTTFGAAESGVVSCGDYYPTGTLRWIAQNQLCTTLLSVGGNRVAAAKAANQAARRLSPQAQEHLRLARAAGAKASVPAVAAAATEPGLPAGFTCDPGFVGLTTTDSRLSLGVDGWSTTKVVLAGPNAGWSAQWRLCHGSGTYPEYVLQPRWAAGGPSPRCLDASAIGFTEGGVVGIANCTGVPGQRFILYTDPVSKATGLQPVSSGSLLAPTNGALVEGGTVSQYGTGRADGTGTFLLRPPV